MFQFYVRTIDNKVLPFILYLFLLNKFYSLRFKWLCQSGLEMVLLYTKCFMVACSFNSNVTWSFHTVVHQFLSKLFPLL